MTAESPNLAADGAPWRVVNDGVMGGISSATVHADAGGVTFRGEVRTEFNGGFASAKRTVAAAQAHGAISAVRVRATGDGHRYRLNLYTRDALGAPQWFNYHAEFETVAGQPTVHRLALADFRAGFRGRPVTDAPPLAWAEVIGVGIMLLKHGHRDGRGPFALALHEIVPVP